MRKALALIGGCVLFTFVTGLHAEEDEAYKQLMKGVGATFSSLGKNVQAKKAEAAAEDGEKLAGLFKQVEDFWVKSNTADAIAFAQAAQKASSEAAASAKANVFDEASAAVGSVGKNCKGCHDAHKPKK
jgi:cytochrome c556